MYILTCGDNWSIVVKEYKIQRERNYEHNSPRIIFIKQLVKVLVESSSEPTIRGWWSMRFQQDRASKGEWIAIGDFTGMTIKPLEDESILNSLYKEIK